MMKKGKSEKERPLGLLITAFLLLLVTAFSTFMLLELLFPRLPR